MEMPCPESAQVEVKLTGTGSNEGGTMPVLPEGTVHSSTVSDAGPTVASDQLVATAEIIAPISNSQVVGLVPVLPQGFVCDASDASAPLTEMASTKSITPNSTSPFLSPFSVRLESGLKWAQLSVEGQQFSREGPCSVGRHFKKGPKVIRFESADLALASGNEYVLQLLSQGFVNSSGDKFADSFVHHTPKTVDLQAVLTPISGVKRPLDENKSNVETSENNEKQDTKKIQSLASVSTDTLPSSSFPGFSMHAVTEGDPSSSISDAPTSDVSHQTTGATLTDNSTNQAPERGLDMIANKECEAGLH